MSRRLLSRRSLLATAAASALASVPLAAVASAQPRPDAPARLTLPAPTGPHPLGTVSSHLVDRSRVDPWQGTGSVRELMVQLWYPALTTHGRPTAPWMSPGTTAVFEREQGIPPGALLLPTTHAHLSAPVNRGRCGRPVVLYSPGLRSDRSLGTALIEELVSHGYVVVAIDHTYDADAVEFPGGRVETFAITGDIDDALVAKALAVRTADTRFVLDQLAALNTGRLAGAFDLSRVGMFGHSLGGATAAATIRADRRLRAGANLDGSLLAPVTAGTDRPFLLFGSDPGPGGEDPSWDQFWDSQHGWKRELALAGSTHISFTDLETLFPQAAPILGLTPEQVARAIGTLEPHRAIHAQRDYLRAFFDLHLRGVDHRLFQRPRYPQVRFVR
ncbi:hydrolase [Actinokineospora auranticolor]|uniref:Platelet-activating factor acetylhydrolase isoform II n=1 Tax=Actinokineospora auranticolor TaxID=155976 RepID=A0A2S6GV28_9PSEU|nr:hydrolase [Actinokineospora auranticolor]PPK69102.1 platelet-activating factor acetylhydrolase isoform II [Actinokineospora auranticolor]